MMSAKTPIVHLRGLRENVYISGSSVFTYDEHDKVSSARKYARTEAHTASEVLVGQRRLNAALCRKRREE